MLRVFTLIGIAIAALIGAFGVWYSSMISQPSFAGPSVASSTVTSDSPEVAAAKTAVMSFGKAQQRVALLGSDASSTLTNVYGSYVAPALLARWKADPQSAPGRIAASPWPDHIDISDIRQTTEGYEMTGTLVMMSSEALAQGGNAGTDPVLIDVAPQGGVWLITNYEDQSGST